MTSYLSEWELQFETKVWSRDSHGLYDYENKNPQTHNFTISSPGQLISKNGIISFKSQDIKDNTTNSDENTWVLATISDSSEGIKITPLNTEEGVLNGLWEIIRLSGNENGHEVKLHDNIRIGRVSGKINQVNRKNDYEDLDKVDFFESISKAKDNEVQERSLSAVCRVCLLEQEEDDNPLIVSCGCVGDDKYMHLECLRKWMMSKINKKYMKNITIIRRKVLSCHLCKQDFSTNVKNNDKEIRLIEFGDDKKDSYVVLEFSKKERNLYSVYMIDLSIDHKYTIGRGYDSNIRLRDISISRAHTFFTIVDGRIYLNDNNSKFGTLVLQKDPIKLNSSATESAWLQCGRTIFRLSLKRSWLRVGISNIGSWFGCNKVEKREKGELEVLGKENRAIKDIQTEN